MNITLQSLFTIRIAAFALAIMSIVFVGLVGKVDAAFPTYIYTGVDATKTGFFRDFRV